MGLYLSGEEKILFSFFIIHILDVDMVIIIVLKLVVVILDFSIDLIKLLVLGILVLHLRPFSAVNESNG